MDCYMGMVTTFAFNWTPMYFAQCNGQLMQIPQNSALYALLGTAFGGNGTTNFNLPDLQGRAPVHFGTASGGSTPRAFAGKFGAESVTITTAQLPAHTHALSEGQPGQTVTATATAQANCCGTGTIPNPAGNYWAKVMNGSSAMPAFSTPKTTTMASDAVQVTVTPTFNKANLAIGVSGNSIPMPVATPSLALNFCICTAGIFPSRT